jgi:hypothetical protein
MNSTPIAEYCQRNFQQHGKSSSGGGASRWVLELIINPQVLP